MFASALSDASWLPGTEVEYDYHVDLDTISKYPVESTSRWTIKGNLVVQGGQDIATVQVSYLCLDYNSSWIYTMC